LILSTEDGHPPRNYLIFTHRGWASTVELFDFTHRGRASTVELFDFTHRRWASSVELFDFTHRGKASTVKLFDFTRGRWLNFGRHWLTQRSITKTSMRLLVLNMAQV